MQRLIKRVFQGLYVSLCLLPTVWAAELIPESSHINFYGTQMGARFEGEADLFTAKATFDNQGNLNAFQLILPVTALNSNNASRDETLLSPAWLNAAQYPEIVFQGQRKSVTDNGVVLEGMLTIKGKSQMMTLNVKQQREGSIVLMTKGSIDRLAFELGTGEWLDTYTVGQLIHFTTNLHFSSD